MNFTEKPEYGRVVDICTRDSLRELATPGLLAVLTPIAVGFAFGYAPLGSFLAGAIAAGALMAVFLANSGGAWDNAKKLVEDGNYGGKGSDAHEATIIGDTVGDPFKDTAGPAINPLIKVMNLVSLLIATSVVKYSHNGGLRAGVAIAAVAPVSPSPRSPSWWVPSSFPSAGRPASRRPDRAVLPRAPSPMARQSRARKARPQQEPPPPESSGRRRPAARDRPLRQCRLHFMIPGISQSLRLRNPRDHERQAGGPGG